jgi:general stress protein CsbA
MSIKEDITDVLNRVLGSQVQGVKLGPGVVGRNSSIAYALELVMLAGVIAGIFLHSVWLVGISLFGAIVGGLLIARMNVTFGKANPAAAILEGAEFLQFHQLQAMATKGDAHVVELPFAVPTQSPVQLTGTDNSQLPGDTEPKS